MHREFCEMEPTSLLCGKLQFELYHVTRSPTCFIHRGMEVEGVASGRTRRGDGRSWYCCGTVDGSEVKVQDVDCVEN